MDSALYHIIVYAPLDHAEKIRKGLAEAGAGSIGEYDSCSFTTKGVGRFRPSAEAEPHIGSSNSLEEVEEERIEFVCPKEILSSVLHKVIETHPYEEPAIHVLPMLDYKDLCDS